MATNLSRRGFVNRGAAAAVSAFGFDLRPAQAAVRELKISRTTQTHSVCPYCAVGCSVVIHTLGDKARNVKPAVVHIEEPRQGIQFGVRLETVGTNQFSAFVFARDRNTSADADPPREMAVSFRTGSPGVIDFRRTAETFRETPETNMGATMESAEYALQMIRFPYRQVFGDPATVPPPIDVVFRASVSLTALHDRFSEVLG